MDTSHEYIKMCEKAMEIQRLRPVNERYELGDMYAFVRSNGIADVTMACPNRFGEMDINHTAETWLPRQDQLQEMLINFGREQFLPGIVTDLYRFADTNPQVNGSFEQLWLGYVMKEKFHKTWNGEEWVI